MSFEFIEGTGSDNPLNSVDLGNYNSTPAFVDIDNDGDLDAFVGKESAVITSYYENDGNANNPSFPSGDANTYSSLNVGNDPTFVDIDNDNDFDAFVGAIDGTVTYFKNKGSVTSASFSEQDSDLFDDASYDISNGAPAFTDIDNDGDLDAYVGKDTGGVTYYENTGSAGSHNFSLGNIPFSGDSNSNPTLVDVDNDGDFDAFIGSGDGTVSYYENTGSASSATFTERTGTDNPFDGIDFGDDSAPVFADIDNDGDYDAFVGSSSGTVRYFENITSVTMTAVASSTAEADEAIQGNHAQFKIDINKANHGGLDIDFSVNSNVQRGISTASKFGDDYRLYYFDSSNNKQYINGDSFTIEDGTDELTVYVEPIDDYVYESDETITITLESSDDYDLEGNSSVSIAIADNEPAVSISDYTTTIYETAVDFGNSIEFDGVDDYIELKDQSVASTFDLGSTAFTITGWLKPSSLSRDSTNHNIENVFLARASDGENDNFELGITTDGKLNLYLDTNSGDNTIELGNGELTTEEWHSFALTFDSGSVTAYIDGNKYTDSINGTELDEADGSPFTIGTSLHIDTFYSGAIDELGIWNTVLTEDEIKDVRYSTLTGDEENLVTYHNFNEDDIDDDTIADVTANANDGTLTNGDGNNFANSENPAFIGHVDLELNNTVANEPGIIVNYQIDSDSEAIQGSDFYSSEVDVSTTDGVNPTNSIFIPQGEDSGRIYLTALADAIAEGDENINLNLVADFNQAISLDGSDDYVAVASDDSLDLSGGKFTIETWIHPDIDDSNTGYNGFFGYKPSGGTKQRYPGMWVHNQTGIHFGFGDGTTWNSTTESNVLNKNEWNHVATSFDGNDYKLYVNGEYINSYNFADGKTPYATKQFDIGRVNNYFPGEIDEVRVWNDVRTDDEIKDNLYKSLTGDENNLAAYYNFNQNTVDGTAIADSTNNGNDGTLITNNQVLALDGTDDFVEIPHSSDLSLNDLTLEAWIYPTEEKTNWQPIVTKENDNGGDRNYGLFIRPNSKKVHYSVFGANSSNHSGNSEGELNLNEWNHVALVVDSGVMRFYLNEVAEDSVNANTSLFQNTEPVKIGKETNKYTPFAGKIDEVRIWDVARSEDDIKNGSGARLSGTEDGLVAYYPFESSANDESDNTNNGSLQNGATTETNNDLPLATVADSFSFDPFAAGGATYNVDGTTSATIEIQDSNSYTPGIIIVDEYGDEVTADNPLVEDANGEVIFSVKLTSEPTDSVSLTVDGLANSITTDTWDDWQEFTVPASTTISVTSNDADYGSLSPAIYTTDSRDTIKLKITEAETTTSETTTEEDSGDSSGKKTTTEEDSSPSFKEETPTLVTGDNDTDTPSAIEDGDGQSTTSGGVELAQISTTDSLDLDSATEALLDVELSQYVTDDSGQESATFDFALAQQPTEDVTVTFNDTANTAIIFTNSDWDQSQQITISNDTDIQVVTTSTDSNYDNQTLDLPISTTTQYNSLDVSSSTLTTSEDGDTVEFGVRLTSPPNVDVTIDMAIGDTEEGVFDDASSSKSITIAPEDWETYQHITVQGVNDFLFDGDTDYSISFDTSSTDSAFDGLEVDSLFITNQDNETNDLEGNLITNLGDIVASLTVDANNTTITEGETGVYTVQLSQAPTEDSVVQYQVISNSATASDDFTELTGEVTVLAGQTSATIDLASLDDYIDEDSETVEIQLLEPFTNVDITVDTAYNSTDNTIGLTLAAGSDDIQISPGDELVFSNGAIATVTAEDPDSLITLYDDQTTSVSVIIDSETGINSIDINDTTTVAIPEDSFDLSVTTDYDAVQGTVGLQLTEAGTALALTPGDEITFSHSTDGTSVTAIVGGTDGIALTEGLEISVPVTLSDGTVLDTNYTSPVYTGDYVLDDAADDFSATLTIDDNDTAKVLITDDAAGTNEISSLVTDEATGTVETVYVQLDSQPTEPVVVYLGTNDLSEGLLSDADETSEELVKLAFSSTDWNVAQEVTVNPVDDDVDEGNTSSFYQQFDFSSVFDSDVVINSGDSSQNTMDNNNVLITDTYAASVSGSGNGLPDDGYFAANGYVPEVQLAYNEDEATDNLNGKIVNYGGDPFSFNVEEKAYFEVHLFATSTSGNSDLEITLNYSDGSTSTSEFTVPDWYNEITETEDQYYLIDGADRYNINTNSLQNSNDPAIFGFKVDADVSKTLASVDVSRKTQSDTNSKLVVFGGTGKFDADSSNYQVISTAISDDVKYNEDNVELKVNGDFDASSDTTISLSIDELSITSTELVAGTQLSFANGMVLEVVNNTSLSNSQVTDVEVTLVIEANQILADTTATVDDDNSNLTEYINLTVTEAYEANGIDEITGVENSGGTLELQIETSSTVSSLTLSAGEQLTLSNGAVFTLDADADLTKSIATVVSGTIDSDLLKVAVTEVSLAATADVNTDIGDDASGETQVIVTSAYDAAAGKISIQINDASASSVELLAGTQINFSNGSAVILDETVTIDDTAPIEISVSGVDNDITTAYTETISTDITVTNTDNDAAGITITASNPIAAEGVGENFFSVQLNSEPIGEVEVTFHPDNDDIQLDDEFDGESTTLTFDADTWDTAQEVQVTAVDDYYVEYDHGSTISTTVSSEADDIYDQLTPPDDLEIKITDNDLPIASIEAIAGASEAGAPGYFMISLDNAAPDGVDGTGIVVTYEVTGGTADVDGDESSETDDLQPLTGSVRIAPGETRSPVIAFPTDDFKVEAVPLVATGYSNNSVTLEIQTANLSDSLLDTLQEEGVTIAAGTELTFSDGAIVTVDSETNLTIDSSETSSSASVGVTFADDTSSTTINTDETTSVPEETVIVSLSTGDDYYIDTDNPASATLSIQDNDKPGVRIVEAGDTTIVNEDGTAEYYVSLLSQPEGEVTISLTGENTAQTLEVESVDSNSNDIGLKLPDYADVTSLLLEAGSYSIGGNTVTVTSDVVITKTAATVALNDNSSVTAGNTLDYSYSELDFANGSDTLTFDSDNWYELQTVTVKGLDDNVVEQGNFHTSRVLYTVSSEDNGTVIDSNYNGFEVSPQSIDIIDRTFDKDNTTESLTEGFLGLQDAIDSISLPIIGNLSSVSPSFLEDFLDNLIYEVKATDEVTADSLSESFNTAFDSTIIESDFDSDLFNLGVEITDLSSENIEFLLNIEGAVGESFPLDSDLGLSALGISLETSGNLNADFDYGIGLAFGINQDDGFYINTDDTAFELGTGLSLSDVDLTDSSDFGITGKLGFLQLDIEDGVGGANEDGSTDEEGTNISAEFTATLQDVNDTNGDEAKLTLSELNAARSRELTDLIQYGFSGDAALDIDVTTSFEGDTSFPNLGFNLYSEMPIFNYDNADGEEELSGATLTIESSGNTTITENSSTPTTLIVSGSGTDSDIKLNKGTELSFNGDKVTVAKNVVLSPDTNENISLKFADDSDSSTSETVTLKQGEIAELVSGDFNIAFNDITLDLGEFVSDTLDPVIGFVEELIEPFEPIIDVLQTEVELLDSLGLVSLFDENDDGAATLIEIASTLATLYSGGENNLKYQQFFDAVTGIAELVETIEELGDLDDETIAIEFGDYVLESFSGASDEEDASTIDTEDTAGSNTDLNSDAADTAKSNNKVGNFFAKLDELGIGIPLLEDPFTAINLLLGQDVDLVTYDIPELDIEFGIEEEFPIFGSIKGLLEGGFSLYSDLVVGYDTNGISQWEETDFELAESYKILDGFYLSDLDPDTGEDVDELTLDATIAAGVSASAVVAKATVKGGVTGTAALDITDGGELTGNSDGKLRGSEVLDADSLLDLFTLSGSLEAFLEATVKVGIDVGFFEIMKTVWSEKFSTTLFEFELGSSGGNVSQYYIEGATVFFDSNLNGEQEEGEPSAVTDAYGRYNLDVPLLFFDTNDNGEIDPEEGRVVSEGGIDTASGLEVDTPLVAAYGSQMVTPLSTLKQNLIEDGATAEEAEAQIKTALDLPDVDLDNFEPIKAIAKGDERGATIYQAHNEVQNLFIQGTELAAGLDSDFDTRQPLNHQVIKEIAQGLVKPGKSINLSNQDDLDRVFSPLGKRISVPGDRPGISKSETLSAFTETVAWGNDSIQQAFKGVPLESVVQDTAATKLIVQGHLGQLQGKLGRGELTPKQLRNKLNGAAPNQPFPGLPGLPPVPPAPQPNPTSEVPDSTHPNYGIEEGEEDVLQPESEINYFNGSQDNNVIKGTQGKDIIDGGIYNNVLSGLGGNDTLLGNKGFDRLNGGAGDDVLDGGEGISVLNGGAGSDTFVLYDADLTWVKDFNPESDRLELARDLTYGSLNFNGEVNTFISYEGNRIATLLDVNPEELSEVLFSDRDQENLLPANSEINYLNASRDNNLTNGSQGRDVINGDIGNNVIFGLDGNDTLLGNKGFDRLNGGAGDDILNGGEGISVLNGGEGSDTFVLYQNDISWIEDFDPDRDRLGMSDGMTYESLDLDGRVNSFISYQGSPVATLLGVNPNELDSDRFVEL